MKTKLAEKLNCSNADKRLRCCIVLRQWVQCGRNTHRVSAANERLTDDSPHLGQSRQQTEHLSLVRDIGEVEPLEKGHEKGALVNEALYGNQPMVSLEQNIAQSP